MPNIKTAISIEETIFDQVNTLAQQLNISRSRLFAIAVQEFLRRHRDRELLMTLNKAYDDLQEPEARMVKKMRPHHMKLVKNQW